MELNLRGGVLMIGSLFWQDDLDRGDGKRKNWRDENLLLDEVVDVKVPIRYGRFSVAESYTMVFDNSLTEDCYGKAKAVPFQETCTSMEKLLVHVERMSGVEGNGSDFVKGNKAWAVCGIIFNPNIDKELKQEILDKWEEKLKENKIGYESFIKSPESYNLSAVGEFLFDFPEEASEYDFLVAVSTKHKLRKGCEELDAEEIAYHVKKRPYFYPNRENGITTFQDDEIISKIK